MITYGNSPDDAGLLLDWVKLELSPGEVITNITGSVLGINTGPRAVALCGYAE